MCVICHLPHKGDFMTRRDYFVEMAYFCSSVRKSTFSPGQCGAAVSLLVAVSDDDYMQCCDIDSPTVCSDI